MKVNINPQNVGTKKPSLFKMITPPIMHFKRMKTKNEILVMFHFLTSL